MWWAIASFVSSFLLSAVLFKPKTISEKPRELDEGSVPTAEVGKEIPVVFGTKDIKSANVVWYGDIRTVPIKKKGGKK